MTVSESEAVLARICPNEIAALTGALVPIRESGSMLPQALLTPFVVRVRSRKLVTVAGALVQAAAVAVMPTAAGATTIVRAAAAARARARWALRGFEVLPWGFMCRQFVL